MYWWILRMRRSRDSSADWNFEVNPRSSEDLSVPGLVNGELNGFGRKRSWLNQGTGYAVEQLVEALPYTPEKRWFVSRSGLTGFSLT